MEPEFTFGGNPVTFAVRDNDVFLHAKGMVGSYSQMKLFLEGGMPNATHQFGDIFQADGAKAMFNSNMQTGIIVIGCAQDTFDNGIRILNHCEDLLGLPLSRFDASYNLILDEEPVKKSVELPVQNNESPDDFQWATAEPK